jgi:cytochrome c556
MRMNRWAVVGVAAMLGIATGSSVLAQDAPLTPEEQLQNAIQLRQGLFKVMGYSFAPVGGMLRNKVPFDAAVAQKSAERIEMLSQMIPDLFQADTRAAKGVKTGALEGIWTSKSDFNAKATEMNKAASAFVAAAKTGDKGATLKAAGALGKSCGSCHDTFRQK